MTPKKFEGNNSIKMDISRTIFTIVLIGGIYGFFANEETLAKLLAAGGSIGVLFLLIMSFKPSSKSKNKWVA